MSGIHLGKTALALLIPAVFFFGLFMFGAGFLSGSFYTERSTPTETVIRQDQAKSSTLESLRQQGGQEKQDEAESLAQTTGSLEEQTAAQSDGQPLPPESPAEEPETDSTARERALAELRAGQETDAPTESRETPLESERETPASQPETPDTPGPFTFQVGAFLIEGNAAELAATLISRGYEAWVAAEKDAEGRLWHFVRVGRYQNREEAMSAAAAFRQRESINAVPVPLTNGQGRGGQSEATGSRQPLFMVYAGAYSNVQAARDAAQALLGQGFVPCVATIVDAQHQTWHLVEIVEFPTRAEAEHFMQQSAQRGAGIVLKLRELEARAVTAKHCF